MRRRLVGRRVASLACAIGLVALARPAGAAKLWIAWDSSVAGCRANVEDMFACVLDATPFTTMAAAYPNGRALTFGGTTVLAHACANVQASASATVADDTATFQCIEDQAGFDLHTDDVVLYYPNHAGCTNGRNHWHIPVTAHGRAVRIEVALSYSGTTCSCQTPFGFHEVYEASADAQAGDCCNGEGFTGCAATPAAYGWYTMNGCASGAFRVQAVSPAAHEFTASYCTEMTVDRTALCAQTRATRTAGRCVGGNLETCALTPTTTDCMGMGCSATPHPHCNTFAATCAIAAPVTMCSGASAPMVVTCTNTGTSAWDGDSALGVAPPATSSAFDDASWVSPTVATRVAPAAVAPSASGTFTVTLHAPSVVAPTPYVEHWALLEVGGAVYATPTPAMLETDITVAPCAPDAGLDAGTPDARVVAGHDGALDGGDAGTDGAGCGCRTVPATRRHGGVAVFALALALAFAQRRAVRDHGLRSIRCTTPHRPRRAPSRTLADRGR